MSTPSFPPRAAQRSAVQAERSLVQVVRNAHDIGAQVRAHRKQQGLRIDDAAALNGVSVDLLSRLENGHGGIRTDKLLTVLDGLGLALLIAPKTHPLLQTLPDDPLLADKGPA